MEKTLLLSYLSSNKIHSPFTIYRFHADGAAGAGPATFAVFSVFSALVPE